MFIFLLKYVMIIPGSELMKLQGTNRSSKKTIELIKKTFAELIEEKKEIHSITVTELTKRADITRGTFYSHFDSIYEVASELESEISEQIFHSMSTIQSMEDMKECISNIFKYIKENENMYFKLLNAENSMHFTNRLSKKIVSVLKQNFTSSPILNIYFFTDGTLELIIRYFKKEITEDLDTIETYVIKMAKYFFFK